MTKKKIAEFCIEKYSSIIKAGKKDNFTTFRTRLMVHDAHRGICNLIYTKFSKGIGSKSFVKKLQKVDERGEPSRTFLMYWFKIPYFAKTKKEAIELINKRIEILKTWL